MVIVPRVRPPRVGGTVSDYHGAITRPAPQRATPAREGNSPGPTTGLIPGSTKSALEEWQADRDLADAMFAQGYRVSAWLPGLFAIGGPLSVRRPFYVINPCEATCDCPAPRGRCKHLRALYDLIRLSANEMYAQGNRAGELELLEHWYQYCAWVVEQRMCRGGRR